MGMYTELVLKTCIKDDIDDKILSVIMFLFGGGICPTDLPAHSFFDCPRWEVVGRGSSFYHHPRNVSSFCVSCGGGKYLFSRSDLKNYDNEIELFLDWFSPLCEADEDACVGWYWYESEDRPTLLIMSEGKIVKENKDED